MQKSLCWSLVTVLLILCFTPYGGAQEVNLVCKSPNPNNFDEVFNCVTKSSIYGVNQFSQIEKLDCASIRNLYIGALRVARSDAELWATPPKCSLFSKVVEELTGKPPFWHGCMNYTNSESHLAECFGGILESTGQAASNLTGQCILVQSGYQKMVALTNDWVDKKQIGLPKNFQLPSCDMIESAFKKIDLNLHGSDCLGFSSDDPVKHLKQCLRADFVSGKINQQISCNQLMEYYKRKVMTSYGRLPDGFSLLRCSVLNDASKDLIAEINKESGNSN